MSTSSTSRSTRKRPAALVEAVSSEEPPVRRARRDVLSTDLETMKAELEHERSLRQLDAKRFQQVKQRLERQVEFAVEEAKEAKVMMDELREESERHMDQLRESRIQAQEELRDCQLQLEEERALGATACLEEDPKVQRLEAEVDAKAMENEALTETMDELRQELRAHIVAAEQEASKSLDGKNNGNKTPTGSASPAPSAVLKELNRVRIQLAESERKHRQLRRATEDLQKNAKQFVHERESARSATSRVQQLEAESNDRTRAYESVQAELTSWKEFGSSLGSLLLAKQPQNSKSLSLPLTADPMVPPELSVVKRYLKEATKRADESETECDHLKKQLDKAQERIQTHESSIGELERKEASWTKEHQGFQKRIELSEKQIQVLKGQEGVWKREMESLRSIVKTFDELPLSAFKDDVSSTGGASEASVRVLQASLDAARQELQILKDGRDGMKRDLDAAVSEKAELQKTHNTVLEKFGKLKEAVYAERAKSEKAEARACHAEELAGKGSFNPETTRVLHLQQNPLAEALRQEVNVLRRQVDALSKEKHISKAAIVAPAAGSDVDPNKLHQRLKQSFKEQIGRFREGVYLMTGYKIDMIPGNERPTFKVRSMFAEQEQDHLMFQWPEGEDVMSLDLLDTELAKLLTTTPSYEYVKRFGSIPTFLASTQLSLFEKQTMM
jgi:mitotic spindle assembly checkpoint protein MAD1